MIEGDLGEVNKKQLGRRKVALSSGVASRRVASRRCPVSEADVAAGSNAGEATPGIA